MPLDLSKLPQGALSDVRQFFVDNHRVRPGQDPDPEIALLTPEEFLDAYLTWNGIIHWTETIVTVIDRARGAER